MKSRFESKLSGIALIEVSVQRKEEKVRSMLVGMGSNFSSLTSFCI